MFDLEPERITWAPGALSSTALDGILIDALADAWRDTYRQGRSTVDRMNEFVERVTRVTETAVPEVNTLKLTSQILRA